MLGDVCVLFTLSQTGSVSLALVLEADGAGVHGVLLYKHVSVWFARVIFLICENAPQ